MICTSCVKKNEFLCFYLDLTSNTEASTFISETKEEVNVTEIVDAGENDIFTLLCYI